MEQTQVPPKKLTKQELLEWSNFLYSRYENKYRKKLLNKKLGREIIKLDSNHDNLKT